MALARKAIAHPAVTRAQVQNAKPILRQCSNTWQNLSLDKAKRTRTECPLPFEKTRKIAVRKRQVVVRGCATPAFRRSNRFIVFHEARVASHALWQECLPDALFTSQPGFARQAIERCSI